MLAGMTEAQDSVTNAPSLIIETMAKWGSGPGWTIDQAMEVLAVLHRPFRVNGYALAMHGSVSRDGKGNDLDLIAVPEQLCVTPPEEMERMMCDLIGAHPVQANPIHGLLGAWSRTCVLKDGRGIDMEYRLPGPIDRQHDWASSLITLFRENGYHLEFFSFPKRISTHYFDLIALPLALNTTPPKAVDPSQIPRSIADGTSREFHQHSVLSVRRRSHHRDTACGAGSGWRRTSRRAIEYRDHVKTLSA